MAWRVSAAAVLAMLSLTASAAGGCPPNPGNPHLPATRPHPAAGSCVNFDDVAGISQQIVAGEPAVLPAKPSYSHPAAESYTGPTLGVAKPDPGVRATPTIGYKWSID